MSPILKSVNPQIYNTHTAPNITEQNNPPVVMAATHPCNFIGKTFPEVIIPDHNLQQKFKAQAGFMVISVVLCPSLYLYRYEVSRDDLME